MASFIDIVLLVFVVLFIFAKLKNVLGTRPEGSLESMKVAEENAKKLFDIIVKEQKLDENAQELSELEQTLHQIPNFDKEKFINAAKRAFEIIITSFAKGELKTLEALVNKTIYKKFADVIEDRAQKKQTAVTDLIGFDKAEIVDAKIIKDVAKIKVEFVSEQMNIIKDESGAVILGDEKYIQKIADTWTFERSIHSKSPNWILSSTKK